MSVFDGRDFIRVARCMALARIEGENPLDVAARLYHSPADEHVAGIIKAAVSGLDTTSDLYSPNRVAAEFVAALRPLTVLGRLDYVPVPFNRPLPFISTGTQADFVGE